MAAPGSAVDSLRRKVIQTFGGDGVAITEILIQSQNFDSERICSNPPDGMCKVVGIYVNPATGQLAIIYDDNPV